MHVLVFAQISGDFAHFGVELNVHLFLFAKQNSVLKKKPGKCITSNVLFEVNKMNNLPLGGNAGGLSFHHRMAGKMHA